MDEWRPGDLLSRVHEVCRLHWRKRGQPDVQIEELESGGFAYLRISYTRGPWTRHELIGVHDGEPDHAVLRRFRELVGDGEAELVFRGTEPDASTGSLAKDTKIWLRAFEDYQRELWDPRSYLRTQNNGLSGDPEYPLTLHVDKRWAPLGDPAPAEQTALPAIMDWLGTDGPRFVLVLGDFGTGKTFLLRTIANELAEHADLVPVLITMRDLEKGRTLDELLAQHMARLGEDPFHGSAFRYLLREGRIVLLFDGFDELALRTSYERVPQHFATLREAATGAAKVVVTSRHQYFATDQAVRNALGDEVHRMQGSRIIRLFPLESGQRRELVLKTFDDDRAADEFIDALRDVPNLLDLATNPRMLSFMIRWYREGILTKSALARSAGEQMTSGALYQLLLTTWLEHEVTRQVTLGGLTPLSVAQRMDALRETAMLMWRTGRRSLGLGDLGEVANQISDLARLEMRPGEAAQAVGSSTVLVRTTDDEFSFIHQSVMEWFVAASARDALAAGTADTLLADSEMTGPMVDFWCDLADSGAVIAWAQDITSREETPGAAAKANASLVLQRRGAQAFTVNYSGQYLRGRDLSGQDFTGANLADANLAGAVLPRKMQHANLSRANLIGARLVEADLTGANLSQADLSRASLIGADLTGANLEQAKLNRAVLIGANVELAQLQVADVTGAALPGINLEPQVIGRSPITVLAALPNDLLASGHEDGTVRIHDAAAARTLRVITAHTGPVTALVAAGDELLASGGTDGLVRVWHAATGVLVHNLPDHQGKISALACMAAADVLVSAAGRRIHVWRLSMGREVRNYEAAAEVTALAINQPGHELMSASSSLQFWSTTNVSHVPRIVLDDIRFKGLVAQSKLIWATDEQGIMRRNLAGDDAWTTVLNGFFSTFTVSADKQWVAATDSKQVTLAHYQRRATVLRTIRESEIRALALDDFSRWLAVADAAGVIGIWHPDEARQIGEIHPGSPGLSSLAVDPSRAQWLGAAGDSGYAFWNLARGQIANAATKQPAVIAASLATGDVALGRSGLGVDIGDELIDLGYDVLGSINDLFEVLVFDPSGRWLAAGVSGTPPHVESILLHEIQTHRLVRYKHAGGVRALAFDPKGRWLASAGDDKQVQLWDARPRRWNPSGFRFTLSSAYDVNALTVVPHRRWLITGGQEDVLAWDVEAHERTALFESTGHPVKALVVGPNSRWLGAGDADGMVRAWYVDTQQIRFTIRAHIGATRALATDPRGRWFASTGDDGVVRLWDRATGAARATLIASPDGWIILLPDGRYKYGGNPRRVWWTSGLCRFDVSDLADLEPYLPGMRRIDEEEPLELSG